MGYLNVRGCRENEMKCMIVDMFKENEMDVLGLKGERELEGERTLLCLGYLTDVEHMR